MRWKCTCGCNKYQEDITFSKIKKCSFSWCSKKILDDRFHQCFQCKHYYCASHLEFRTTSWILKLVPKLNYVCRGCSQGVNYDRNYT